MFASYGTTNTMKVKGEIFHIRSINNTRKGADGDAESYRKDGYFARVKEYKNKNGNIWYAVYTRTKWF